MNIFQKVINKVKGFFANCRKKRESTNSEYHNPEFFKPLDSDCPSAEEAVSTGTPSRQEQIKQYIPTFTRAELIGFLKVFGITGMTRKSKEDLVNYTINYAIDNNIDYDTVVETHKFVQNNK